MAKQTQPLVAMVTGASSGMGKDLALRLLDEGYVVFGAARRLEQMQDIAARGGTPIRMDVTDLGSMREGLDVVINAHGHIDILVNCAGYGQYGAIEDVPMGLARKQMDVNLFGVAGLTQMCLPYMRSARQGWVINISSIGGKITTPLGGWYHASKFALEGWSDVLRNEVRGFGIHVVVIEPGGIASEWSGIAAEQAREISGHGPYTGFVDAFLLAQSQLGEPPQPQIISDLVVKALRARNPRPRYVGGQMAHPLLFLRRWLPDRTFDRLIMSSFRGAV